MKVKLSEIVGSQQALIKLMQVKLPIQISYKLSKLAFKLEPELKIYNDQRNALIKELGEQINPETDEWRVKADNLVKFQEEQKKLQEIEVDVKFAEDKELEKIKVSDLGDVQIEANDLIALDWLLEA